LIPLSKNIKKKKPKGFKSFVQSLESNKEEVEKLLETKGLSTKTEVVAPSIEVTSMSRKDKPLEIDEEKDTFYLNKKEEKEENKKKKPKQGPKSIPVSNLQFKSKRHKGFNRVREDREKPKGSNDRRNKENYSNKRENVDNRDRNQENGDYRSQNYDDRGWGGNNRPQGKGRKINIESTSQFPPLSGNIIPQTSLNWGPPPEQN